MRLAQFIRHAQEDILAESLAFATQIPALSGSAISVLRNHLPIVLNTIALDLEAPQSRTQSIDKSLGHAAAPLHETAAQSHGTLRARIGLDIEQLVAEYRVLRSCVLRLWAQACPPDQYVIEDTMRFNEAIDQAVAESVAFYAAEKECWRNLFLAVLGHDLRDPLHALLLTAELMERKGQSGPMAGALVRNARRLRSLLDSLLEYTQLTLGVGTQTALECVNLGTQCEEEIEILHRAFPDRDIVFATSGDTQGLFDSSRVRQALANLVSNAVHHSPKGSPITVAVTGRPEAVEISTRNPAEPLAQEVLDTLFEPLRRNADKNEDSTGHLGLGLFIVREITKAHLGEVTARTTEGTIEFKMVLPKSPTASVGPAPACP